jgi:hypothetical protein
MLMGFEARFAYGNISGEIIHSSILTNLDIVNFPVTSEHYVSPCPLQLVALKKCWHSMD